MQGWLDDYFATKCMLGEHHAKQLCVAFGSPTMYAVVML